MPRVSASLVVARPPAEVFAAVADPAQRRRLLPDNFTGFRVVAGGEGPGTRTAFTIETAQGAHTSEIELAAWDPPHSLTEQALGESPYTMRWTFAPAAGGTEVSVTMEYTAGGSPLHRLVERVFARRALQQSVLVELLRLKEYVEAKSE